MANLNSYGVDRATYVGGPEVATIVGANPYDTLLGLYETKLGIRTGFEGNNHSDIGLALEPYVLDKVSKYLGMPLQKPTFLRHKEHSFLAGSPDAFIEGALIEAKTTAMASVSEDAEIPEYWIVQMQYYMGLSGRTKCHLGVQLLSGNKEFFVKEFIFDKEYYDFLIDAATNFWFEHIIKRVAPEPSNNEDLKSLFPVSLAKSSNEATEEAILAIAELKEIKINVALEYKRKEELEFIIKEAIAEKEALKSGDILLATYKSSTTNRLDAKSLTREHPDLVAPYKTQSQTRRLLIK